MRIENRLIAHVEKMASVLDEVLKRHGASMTPEDFCKRYTALHEAKMVVAKWKKNRKRA